MPTAFSFASRIRGNFREQAGFLSLPQHANLARFVTFVFVGWRGDSRALLHVAHAGDGFERGDALGELALVFGAHGDVPHFAAWAR